MRSLYLVFLKYKDHFVFFLAVILSLSFLLRNDSPNIYLIRGKFSDFFSFINYPISWVKNMSQLQHETQLLREKNIQLSLQLESFLVEHEENKRLKELLNYKRESILELLPAKIINMGSSLNISSFTLDVGSNNGVKVNQAVLVPQGIVGKTLIVGNTSTIVQSINDVNFRLSVSCLLYTSDAADE